MKFTNYFQYCSLKLISEYTFETGLLKKVSVHHQYQEYSKDDEIQESLETGDLVLNHQIVAIAAETSFFKTVWLVRVIDINVSISLKQQYRHLR